MSRLRFLSTAGKAGCSGEVEMITLFSYPELFGLADNSPYGLKVFAFLKLCQLVFGHEHVFDAKMASRDQLPYIIDDDEIIGDSEAIISHLIKKHHLPIDNALTGSQQPWAFLFEECSTICIG
jgi:hypothetical protein